MGNLFGSPTKMSEEPAHASRDYFDVVDVNGYFLEGRYIPEEILILILSHVDPKNLVFNCRRVCKAWCNVIDRDVWKIKSGRKKIELQKLNDVPWFVYFWILTKQVLNRNLIKNGCGQENLSHWEILSSGGDQWTVESPPVGTTDLPRECISEELLKSNSCFATSYYSCSKKQVIDLKSEGAIPYFMNEVHPHIRISEWYCGRFDCRSTYELKVTLLDENADALEEFEVTKNVGGPTGSTWEQMWALLVAFFMMFIPLIATIIQFINSKETFLMVINHVFEEYSPGVRYVEFYHGGMDSQFWQGHYGSKMTGASVVLSLP